MRVGCACGMVFRAKEEPSEPGLLVMAFTSDAFVCPACGTDAGPMVAESIAREGIREYIGVGAFNPRGLTRLQIQR